MALSSFGFHGILGTPNVVLDPSRIAALGVIYLLTLTLPAGVTAFAGIQALWWLAAAIALMVRSGRIAASP